MGEAIGQMLPFAVGVAVSPMPIVAVVLMLVMRRACINGPAYLVGWVIGIGIVGAIALVIAGPTNVSEEGQPADWVGWLKLILGVLLLLVGLREWRARPAEGEEAAAFPRRVDKRLIDRRLSKRRLTPVGARSSRVHRVL
jgi:threonine/homoserine/homoserine lactone efflux protein